MMATSESWINTEKKKSLDQLVIPGYNPWTKDGVVLLNTEKHPNVVRIDSEGKGYYDSL